MHLLFLSSFAGVAVAIQPQLLFGRQDYTVSPSGPEVICPDEFICGGACRPSNYFCCADNSHPCQNGDYCLGSSGCCYANEDVSVCAARNGITLPASFTAPVPAPSSAAPVVSASNPILSTTLSEISASVPTLSTKIPVVSASLPTLSSKIPVITPSYPVGNATLPAPTGTGKPSASVTPFTGGVGRLSGAGWMVGAVGVAFGVMV